MQTGSSNVTRLLHDMRDGSQTARERLIQVVYRDLKKLAARYLRRERQGHSLQATALVHELYLRLMGASAPDLQNRAHFFAVASQLMRRILIDHARKRTASKRGGPTSTISIDETSLAQFPTTDLLALDQALSRLAIWDARQASIVEMKFFGGLTEDEIAEALGVSVRTVKREWAAARAWLYAQLKASDGPRS